MTEISRRQFAVYLIAVVLVVLLGGRALRAGGADGSPGAVPAGGFVAGSGSGGGASDGASALDAGGTGAGSGATGASGPGGVEVGAADERVVVDVAGAVRRPGVYELPAGSRIRDALRAAGGGRNGADLALLNRAAKISDGQQVLVVKRGRSAAKAGAGGSSSSATSAGGAAGAAAAGAGGAAAAGAAPPASVDVNQADATALEALNGVGPAIAAKIVDWRTQNGPFKTVDDLSQVAGIGPKKLEAMRSQVVL